MNGDTDTNLPSLKGSVSLAFSKMPITVLPNEIISFVLTKLGLVRNIKGVKRTCRAFRDAAPAAEQAHRRVCFEHANAVY